MATKTHTISLAQTLLFLQRADKSLKKEISKIEDPAQADRQRTAQKGISESVVQVSIVNSQILKA